MITASNTSSSTPKKHRSGVANYAVNAPNARPLSLTETSGIATAASPATTATASTTMINASMVARFIAGFRLRTALPLISIRRPKLPSSFAGLTNRVIVAAPRRKQTRKMKRQNNQLLRTHGQTSCPSSCLYSFHVYFSLYVLILILSCFSFSVLTTIVVYVFLFCVSTNHPHPSCSPHRYNVSLIVVHLIHTITSKSVSPPIIHLSLC